MSGRTVDDRTLRQYVLGTLTEPERLRIEAELLASDARSDALAAVEDDLVQEYAQGGLSEGERRVFEERYLATPEGRRRLEAAHALLSWLEPPAPAAQRRVPAGVRWLAAAAALLVAAGTAWLGWRASQERVRQTSAPSPNASTPPTLRPTLVPNAPRLVGLALTPGLVRVGAAPTRVTIPREAVTLRLMLTLPAGISHSLLSAALTSAEGAPVWIGPPRVADNTRTAIVDLPAQRIPEGDYELVMRRAGARGTEEIAAYAFTVLRD